MLIAATALRAQARVELVNGDTVHIFNCPTSSGTVVHLHNYETTCFDGWARIRTFRDSVDAVLTFLGGGTDTLEGSLRIWDGDSATGTLLLENITDISLPSNIRLRATSGLMTVHLRYNTPSTPQYHNFRLDWRATNDTIWKECSGRISWARLLRVSDTEADIRWYSPSERVLLIYGDQRRWVTGDTAHLTGLAPNYNNIVWILPDIDSRQICCGYKLPILTDQSPCQGCPDVTDLGSLYVRCYSGSFGNPTRDTGQAYNRHTIHTDPNELDPRTNNNLHTVFPGSAASVRLGNHFSSSQAEAITYLLDVDTMDYSLLLLRYAAVMENPNHRAIEQPRFKLEILNLNNQLIDPMCGGADFIANSALGWNQGWTDVLWKDWTTVGFDMTPYHGQNIRIKFTTYDCSLGAHYGYAYFTADCARKVFDVAHCGETDSNILTAPEGFLYRWYYTNPNDYFSTARSISYESVDEFVFCDLLSTENPECRITMKGYMGPRWPLAIIDTLSTTDRGCNGFDVAFLNRSTIANSNGTPVGSGEMCETAVWDFGDGSGSTAYSPTHTYRNPGTYTVSLVAGIGNGQCMDTTTFTLIVPDRYIEATDSITACDSLTWRDNITYTGDTVGPTYRSYSSRCDTIYTLVLNLFQSKNTLLPVDTFCYSEQYTWRGQSVGVGGENLEEPAHYRLVDRMLTSDMCDSAIIQPLVQLPPDNKLRIEYVVDCHGAKYDLKAISDLPIVHWSSEPYDPLLEGQAGNRKVEVIPVHTTQYSVTSERDTPPPCPTTKGIILRPVTFPKAELKVNPEFLYYGQTEVAAHDIGRKHTSRKWDIVEHYPHHSNMIHLPDTLSYIFYSAPVTIDSLTVMLIVSNDLCLDSAQTTLPFRKTALFVPNIFTPDEATNQRFIVLGHGILEAELSIFNRQGLHVYTTRDLEEGWDGTHHGKPCPQAAYVWLLRYRGEDHPDEWHTERGIVTLLR